jgi:hypothetical protein
MSELSGQSPEIYFGVETETTAYIVGPSLTI